jgi:flagellin
VPININTNVASIRGQRFLNSTSENLSNTYSKLSSGKRINRASDDAAGLAIADSLKNNQRIASVAVRNAQDGISTVSIADGALDQVSGFLQRLAELAQQAASGSYTAEQRTAMQGEFTALGSEIERIAVTTVFNGVALLSGGNQIVLQVGFDSKSTSQLIINQPTATLAGLGLADAGKSFFSFSLTGTTVEEGQSSARAAIDGVNGALQSMNVLRGGLGSSESRLLSAISNLQVARENLLAAESRIRDVDVATEAAELTRLNILQQTGAAVLAQANQQPQLALTLLR